MKSILVFIEHLRLPYMFGVLSAPYLISALFVDQTDWIPFFFGFIVIHAFLFGGATAFNSYWDKDEGPVGGLKKPKKMTSWMQPLSIAFMLIGWICFYSESLLFQLLYGSSFFLFWAYSHPSLRWKGNPILSLFTIGISTGSNSFLMAVILLQESVSWYHFVTSLGVACLLTAMYPISQLFQIEEDQERGDITFAIRFGKKGIINLFWGLNAVGLLFVTVGLFMKFNWYAILFPVFSLIPMFIVHKKVVLIQGVEEEYEEVMKLKYVMSLSFVMISIVVILVRFILGL